MGLGGGGVLMLYLGLTELGQRAAQGVNLIFILPVGLAGLCFHWRNGLVQLPVALPILLGGVLGVALGSILAGQLSEPLLRRLFGILLLLLGARELWGGIKMKKPVA